MYVCVLIVYIICLPVHTLFNAHTYIHLYLINHRHSRSPLFLPLLSTLSALCVVAAHFILILVLRLFRNNRNIRCDRDVDCAAAVVSDLASIFSVSVAALSTPSPPSRSLCWQLCCCFRNDFLSLQHYIILINIFTIITHTHSLAPTAQLVYLLIYCELFTKIMSERFLSNNNNNNDSESTYSCCYS